jgi:hypothetical protein
MTTTTPMHERAIDWALAKGYSMSVRDYSCDDYDCKFSTDRAEILDHAMGTDLPNVEIFAPTEHIKGCSPDGIIDRRTWKYVCTFSIIDEGVPEETINDYTVSSDNPLAQEFDAWFSGACNDY